MGTEHEPLTGNGSSNGHTSANAPVDEDGDGTISWAELATETGGRLAAAGIEGAQRHGRLIVMRACGADSNDWPELSAEPATKRGVVAIDAMTARHLTGEPLQYVLSEWGFRHLELYIDRRVLIPRPETEVVAGAALAELHRLAPGNQPVTAVDLGTGSGAIGLSLLTEHLGVEMWMTDVSDDALAVARANLAGVGQPGARARIATGSWFEALPEELAGTLGLIVANPPYVADSEVLPPEVAEWEPTEALFGGATGTEQVEHLILNGPRWLNPDGALVIEMSPPQVEPMVEMAADRFADAEVVIDLTGRRRGIVARKPRTSV